MEDSKEELTIIGRVHTVFSTKFGVPRQSGLAPSLKAKIVLEPEFRNPDVYRGIEGFSKLWIIWSFSLNKKQGWSPTVRPPRLGGNTHMGVFATRSPFRPNGLGLSCVTLEKVEWDTREGPVLIISGGDMVDGTPVYDIKPYVPYADAYPDARGGFTEWTKEYKLQVEIPELLLQKIPLELREGLKEVLSGNPAPSYQKDGDRIYGMEFGGLEVKFKTTDNKVTVIDVENK